MRAGDGRQATSALVPPPPPALAEDLRALGCPLALLPELGRAPCYAAVADAAAWLCQRCGSEGGAGGQHPRAHSTRLARGGEGGVEADTRLKPSPPQERQPPAARRLPTHLLNHCPPETSPTPQAGARPDAAGEGL